MNLHYIMGQFLKKSFKFTSDLKHGKDNVCRCDQVISELESFLDHVDLRFFQKLWSHVHFTLRIDIANNSDITIYLPFSCYIHSHSATCVTAFSLCSRAMSRHYTWSCAQIVSSNFRYAKYSCYIQCIYSACGILSDPVICCGLKVETLSWYCKMCGL